MKKVFILWFFAYLGVFSYTYSQTVYVPGGNAGILDSNNSNVGVGIAPPTEKIHMLGNLKLDGHAGIIFNTPDASDPYNYIAFKVQDERKWLIDYGTVQTNNLRFLRFSGGQFKTFLNLDYDNLEVELLDVNVGIGTANPGTFKLAVNGNIRAKEIKVETGWSDFVFEEDYDLPTLEEVEKFIKVNKHLPGIPSAKEVKENGVELGKMDSKLLLKIEELTLYMIELKKENNALKEKMGTIDDLRKRLALVEKR